MDNTKERITRKYINSVILEEVGQKMCSKCKMVKGLEDYYCWYDSNLKKVRRQCVCKDCDNKRQRKS